MAVDPVLSLETATRAAPTSKFFSCLTLLLGQSQSWLTVDPMLLPKTDAKIRGFTHLPLFFGCLRLVSNVRKISANHQN